MSVAAKSRKLKCPSEMMDNMPADQTLVSGIVRAFTCPATRLALYPAFPVTKSLTKAKTEAGWS